MAYVTIPKDLSRIQSKDVYKRQFFLSVIKIIIADFLNASSFSNSSMSPKCCTYISTTVF